MGARAEVFGVRLGIEGTAALTVSPHHLASFMGNIDADVLSTHHLVLLMEMASRVAVDDYLPDGMITVGTMINIRHLAASPLGAHVRARSVLKRIDGRRLLFDVVAQDEFGKIAEGENEQLIVSVEKFLRRVRRKQVPR